MAISVEPRLDIEKVSLKAVAAKWPKTKSSLAFDPLFLSQKGGKLTTSAMGQMIAELVKAAGELVPEEVTWFSSLRVSQNYGDVQNKRIMKHMEPQEGGT